uniref:P2Y receptor family member 8 n=2 Tax=Equus asinus TaxID=9793 RepID=A0A9L0JD08_EQUAS
MILVRRKPRLQGDPRFGDSIIYSCKKNASGSGSPAHLSHPALQVPSFRGAVVTLALLRGGASVSVRHRHSKREEDAIRDPHDISCPVSSGSSGAVTASGTFLVGRTSTSSRSAGQAIRRMHVSCDVSDVGPTEVCVAETNPAAWRMKGVVRRWIARRACRSVGSACAARSVCSHSRSCERISTLVPVCDSVHIAPRLPSSLTQHRPVWTPTGPLRMHSRSAPEPSAMMDMNLTQPDNATLLMLQDPTIAVALPVVYSLVALVSIPGNLFSLWVLCRHIGPQSPSVIFMINLSVTDLTLASVLPFQIYYHCNGHHWVFGELLCNAVTVAFYANMYSSILTMTCISVDRFLGVVYPLASARWRRRRYAVAACVAMWLLLLAALSPLARTDLTYAVEALGIVTCFDVLKSTMLPSVAMWAIFLFTLFIVLFLIPFVVTVACYTATILKLLRTLDPHGRGQRRRAVCLAAVVLLAFVTCFAPNNFVLLVHMVSRLFFGRSYYHVYKLTLCLSCLNNCLDPFVYYFASREFQLRLRDYLGYGRLPTDGTEARQDSLFSARTLSARSTASGHADGPEGAGRPCLKRQESLL